MRIARFAVAALVAAASCVVQADDSAHARLARLAQKSYSAWLDLFPQEETLAIGAGPRMARLEAPFTPEHERRERAHFRALQASLARIPAASLRGTDRVTYRLLEQESRFALERLDHPLAGHFLLVPLDGGIAADMVRLVSSQPLRNDADHEAWLARLARYPAFLAAARERLAAEAGRGFTTPRILVERTIGQLEALAPEDGRTSALWRPAQKLTGPRAKAIAARYEAVLGKSVLPALREFTRYVREEYLPLARTSDGIGAVPGGEAIYRMLVRQQTTTGLAPDAIHELGLAEVKRIQLQVMLAAGQAGFKGELRDLRTWLRTDPANFPFKEPQEVIDYLRAIHARILPQLPKLFGRLPRAPLDIRLADAAVAATAPPQWMPPSADGTRPAAFVMPVVDAREVSIVSLTSLLAHEGMPGHHLEGSLTRERHLPAFRRDLWINAYGEGWALYAESLGHEMGLYAEPVPLIGRYLDELARAARLVVDTGLHAKGWTREEATAFMIEEGGLSEQSAEREVLRYMAWPAQALGYKIGEITLRDLREMAEQRLGERFDLREFHDRVLAEGQVPLDLLRSRIEEYVAAAEARSRPRR